MVNIVFYALKLGEQVEIINMLEFFVVFELENPLKRPTVPLKLYIFEHATVINR